MTSSDRIINMVSGAGRGGGGGGSTKLDRKTGNPIIPSQNHTISAILQSRSYQIYLYPKL